MVIMVDAGAVAAASADSTMEKAMPSRKIQNVRTNTNSDATNDSNTVMTITFPPFFFSLLKRKNCPTPNAIKASAMSERKAMPSITCAGINFKQYGPITIPVMIYAVTLGSLNKRVMRVAANPHSSIIATEMMITGTLVAPPNA